MTFAFPQVLVGDLIHYESLSVFPLFAEAAGAVDYVLSNEAIGLGSVDIKEISESGSVPELLVENRGDRRVLFLEGEELVGAKQNRILNTSLLLAPRSTTRIPVSCVEQGRWRHTSPSFASGSGYSPSSLRRKLRASVARSVDLKRGHRSDQGEIWHEVAMLQNDLSAPSPTGALADTFESHKQQITDFHEKFKYMDGASGLATAIAGKVAAIDLFDKSSTCQAVWNRIISGYVFDSLRAPATDRQVDKSDVNHQLRFLERASWKQVEPVGEGEELRAETEVGDHLFVLSFDDRLVHGGAMLSRS